MKTVTLVTAILLICGCASQSKLKAIRAFADDEQITGIDKDTRFEYRLALAIPGGPTSTHRGPYRSIDDVHVNIRSGQYTGRRATFFLGQSRETGTWEVFYVMVENEGKWEAIPLTQPL